MTTNAHGRTEIAAVVRGGRGRSREGGFTYIGLLVVIALIGFALAQVGEVWSTVVKRQKEEELLWVGKQYRQALAGYYRGGGGERFPHKLEDLLLDPRTPNVRRYLRQLYPDPITGSTEWGLVKVGDLITGVYSLSEEEPMKKKNFDLADQVFEDKEKYKDWVFTPPLGRMGAMPWMNTVPGGVTPAPGANQAPGSNNSQNTQSSAPSGNSISPSPLSPFRSITPGLSR